MDLAVLRGDRVARNEVYFDRVALGPGSVAPPLTTMRLVTSV
jgi:hypothetical protein